MSKIIPLGTQAEDNDQIAIRLHDLADRIANGEYGEEVQNVICTLVDSDGQIERISIGHELSFAEAIGMLALAVIRGAVEEEVDLEDGETE